MTRWDDQNNDARRQARQGLFGALWFVRTLRSLSILSVVGLASVMGACAESAAGPSFEELEKSQNTTPAETFPLVKSNPDDAVLLEIKKTKVMPSDRKNSTNSLLPEKYTHRWNLFCNDRPEYDGCEIEKFSEDTNSFTSLMGFQDDAFIQDSHRKNPSLPVIKYAKFVPAEYISLRRSGTFKDSEYCVKFEKILSKNTTNLIHTAHGGKFSRIHFLDYYFLTYINFPKLKRVLADRGLPENIVWKNALGVDEGNLVRLPSSHKLDAKYQFYEYYKIPGTDYLLYKSKINDVGRTAFANTEYASLGLSEMFSYYSRVELKHNGSTIQTPLPSFIAKDFMDKNGVYLIGQGRVRAQQAPDKLDEITIFYLDTRNPPPLKITSYCTINFIFKPT